jgi:Spy/CpxP family protein refolding chaperone
MKRRFALPALMLAFALPISAQGMRSGGMMGAVPHIDTLTSQLTLTAEQKPKVAAAVTAYEVATKDAREFMSKAMASGGMQGMRDNPDAQKHMTTIREARTKLSTDIKAAVTPEQAAKYDELYAPRRRQGGQ